MASGWAGLPGFLLTLPLSTLVVGAYFLLSYAAEVRGSNIHVTDYHAEFGFIVCAFLHVSYARLVAVGGLCAPLMPSARPLS